MSRKTDPVKHAAKIKSRQRRSADIAALITERDRQMDEAIEIAKGNLTFKLNNPEKESTDA